MKLPNEIRAFLYRKLEKTYDYKGGIKACCFQHQEDTPSFFVFYVDKYNNWFYKCHGCGISGSLHNLMSRLNGPIEFTVKPQYINKPIEEEKYAIHREDSTIGMPDIVDYYETRGISMEVARAFGFRTIFGISPAAVMPVYFKFKYVGSVKRYLDPAVPYRYELEDGCDFSTALWAWDHIDPTLPTVICEGIIDAAVSWSSGTQAVAIITGKKWEGKIDYLRLLQNPICIPDNGDANSLDSFFELKKKIGGRLVFLPPNVKDLSHFIVKEQNDCTQFLRSLNE